MKTIAIDISVLKDQQKTGIGIYAYQLIKALLKVNKKDKFILFGISDFDNYHYLKKLEFKNYPNVKLEIKRVPIKLLRTTFLLWQKLNWPPIESYLGPIDLYHSFNWFIPPQKKVKIIATVYDMTVQLYPNFHEVKNIQLETIRLERIKSSADLVITISENTKNDFLKFSPQCRVEIIYPGVSDTLRQVKNKQKINPLLEKYKLTQGYFLTVATLEPRKNIEGLLEAYLSTNLKNKLVLVGKSGWKNNDLINKIKKSKGVRWIDYVSDEDLSILYNQALCLVYPTYYEGFGMPVMEALSLGVPVICSNTSSLLEVGGLAPLYIDPRNIISIKKAMLKVSKQEKLRKEMIQKGTNQVKKFSWERSAKKLNLLYQSLLAK